MIRTARKVEEKLPGRRRRRRFLNDALANDWVEFPSAPEISRFNSGAPAKRPTRRRTGEAEPIIRHLDLLNGDCVKVIGMQGN